jgi:malate dehydrogenase (oxaloacetate-decarboxylating)(NADP+)
MPSTPKHGIELLHDPSLNKSTAFTEAEKQAFGLIGLVSDITETSDLQLQRVITLILSEARSNLSLASSGAPLCE